MVSKSVIVIGAGIAGLTAAYYLSKLGMAVTVLEASERIGGRMSTDRREGYLIDRGVQFLSDGYSVIYELINELGLAQHLARTCDWTGTVRGGTVRRTSTKYPWTVATSGLLSWSNTFRMARASLSLLRQTKRLPLSNYSKWHIMDDADAATWIAASFGEDALEYIFEPLLDGLYFQAPEQMSRAWPAIVWNFGMRRKGVTVLTGGSGSLPETLAQKVNVCLSTPAELIDTTGLGVKVKTPSGYFLADYAVLATPATAASKIYTPQYEWENLLIRTDYSASINISFAIPNGVSMAKVPKDIYGLLIPRRERQVIAAIGIESRKCKL
jgi:oxygen-dependent protoporphyrinogen oxidase